MARTFVITADGGSRGNPGESAYGAVIYEGSHVVAELSGRLGVATNNVAEYRGLIAGLKAAHDIDPHSQITVRMDSKLVVEQDRKSTRLNSSHVSESRMPSSA